MATGLIVVRGEGPLTISANVVLDANGNGSVELGPVPASRAWAVTRITVSCTGTNLPMPVANVYDGPPNPANLLDATYTGGQDVSDFGTPYILDQQESLTVEWVGGVPGETATARLIGQQVTA
jgi:hypothetical protein